MTVFTDAIIDDAFVDQTLDNRDIQRARRLTASTADASDLTVIHVQKRRQAFDPLIQQLSSMDQHKCVDTTLCDQPGCHHCFAKCRGRCEHARSEEHTSELQSPCNLVCRLLLEKKKKKQ